MRKFIFTFFGILLIASGAYFIYDGYQLQKSTVAKVEKGVSDLVTKITDNSVKTGTDLNKAAKMRMIGGAVDILAGLLALGWGFTKKR